eukprot:4248924-Prymnesium_polylepis.1
MARIAPSSSARRRRSSVRPRPRRPSVKPSRIDGNTSDSGSATRKRRWITWSSGAARHTAT